MRKLFGVLISKYTYWIMAVSLRVIIHLKLVSSVASPKRNPLGYTMVTVILTGLKVELEMWVTRSSDIGRTAFFRCIIIQ